MEQCEWKLLPQAVSLFCQDRLRVEIIREGSVILLSSKALVRIPSSVYSKIRLRLFSLIHTYQDNSEPLPSFEGEPRRVTISAQSAQSWAEDIWASLDPW